MVRTRAKVRQENTGDESDNLSSLKPQSGKKKHSTDKKEADDLEKIARNSKKRKSMPRSHDEVVSESSRKRARISSGKTNANDSQPVHKKKPVKKVSGDLNDDKARNESSATQSRNSNVMNDRLIDESSSDDESDWEEVAGESSASEVAQHDHSLEITLAPSGQRSKEDELKRIIQRALRKMYHEARQKLHQITLLCYTAHAVSLSKLCNNDLLRSIALSIIPPGFTALISKSLDDDKIIKFVKWFKNTFTFNEQLEQSTCDNTCRIVMSLPVLAFTSISDSLKRSQKVDFESIDVKLSKLADVKAQTVSNKFKSFESSHSKANVASKDIIRENEEKFQKKETCNYWAEIYKEKNEAWIPVNCVQQTINDCKSIENGASLPILYVLSADNDNSIKDVTARYNSSYVVKSIRKLRLQEEWWQETLTLKAFKSKKPLRERLEDMQLEKFATDLPFPTKIADFKHHPIYVLKRDILKFQLIYPVDTKPAGFFRDEPVYLRENLHTLHTKETWLKDARSVKNGEEPLKKVKGRQKSNKNDDDDRIIPLYGKWQTKKYVPPVAKDGVVPRNQFGNVDLFKECMLPKGTVHLRHPGMLQIAKKLQIDCAQAMIGWDFHGRSSHPVFDGVIVCKENEKTLIDAWDQDQAALAEKEKERKTKRALKNWKRLIKGLLSRDQVKTKFGKFSDPKNEEEAGTSFKQDSSMILTSNVSTQPSWLKNCDEFTFSGY
uniref:Uncharacterized protein n=1 Tax=Romanomermis culicivorax TaxID=13658 RepID=A0A915HUT2_ROMCU